VCTLIILRRPGHPWPVLIAANRDELGRRAAVPPARHWPDRPGVVAGLDVAAGGSWLGLNDDGLVAAVMNRTGTLGPAAGKRSRGELVLEALDHAEADAAAGALADLNPAAYRPFNLVLADPGRAYWVRHDGAGPIRVHPIPPGLHLLSATELDDPEHPRIALHRPRFLAAALPRPESGDWAAWRALLADPDYPESLGPEAAMVQERPDGFGTRSSALIALPAYPRRNAPPRWLHAEGRPDRTPFLPVTLEDAQWRGLAAE
jgi:uncharacterized protein with NRDE domain